MLRAGVSHWGAARAAATVAGGLVGIAALAPPFDALGQDGLLTVHVVQHVALADLAAPLVLIGLPPAVAAALGAWLDALGRSRSVRARLLALALSPIGGFVLWVGLTYFWLIPAVHRAAIEEGIVHGVDHVAFFVAGLLVWLNAFDPRRRRPVLEALRRGGLPWWVRHIYAATTRIAMLPPAFVLWFAAESAYYRDAEPLPFDVSRAVDQERAASVMIGFELLLSGLAVVLAFVFVSVHEGRARARGSS